MLMQLRQNIIADLQKGKIVSFSHLTQQYSMVNPGQMTRLMSDIYKQDQGNNYDLFCHISLQKQNQIRIQEQLYSNMHRGIILNYSHDMQSSELSHYQIKQFHIRAIFPKQLSFRQVKETVMPPLSRKQNKYVNKHLQSKGPMVVTTQQSQKPVQEKPKLISKQSTKSQDMMQKKPSVQSKETPMNNIQSKQIKPQSKPMAVPTPPPPARLPLKQKKSQPPIQIPPSKPIQQPKLTPGVKIQSDQQYFFDNGKAKGFSFTQDKDRQTDGSGKKSDPQKMEIQEQRRDLNFIDDNSEDQDDAFYEQMEKAAMKKQSQDSNTQSKNKNKDLGKTMAPKTNEAKKVVDKPKFNGFANWLKPSK